MKKNDILKIFRSKSTVFTFKDVSLIFGETNIDLVKSRVNYYVKTKKLYQIRKGIYSIDKNYDKLELATKIYTPSYISLETVLQKEGIIFQFHKKIFVVSYLTREISLEKEKYSYKKIKNEVLTNPLGLEKRGDYFIAIKERAFLDAIYLYGEQHFDNLSPLNWELCFKILPIYENKNLTKRLESYKSNHVKH